MHLIANEEFQKAIAKEGLLNKAKPGLISIYQERHCKILDDGSSFGYSKKKEDFETGHISGRIPIKAILEISPEKSKAFTILIEGRLFKFKAKDTSERDKWVDALKILHPYASRRYEQWEAEIKAFDHNFVVDNRLDDSEDHADLNPIGRAVGNTVGVAAGIIKKGSQEARFSTKK